MEDCSTSGATAWGEGVVWVGGERGGSGRRVSPVILGVSKEGRALLPGDATAKGAEAGQAGVHCCVWNGAAHGPSIQSLPKRTKEGRPGAVVADVRRIGAQGRTEPKVLQRRRGCNAVSLNTQLHRGGFVSRRRSSTGPCSCSSWWPEGDLPLQPDHRALSQTKSPQKQTGEHSPNPFPMQYSSLTLSLAMTQMCRSLHVFSSTLPGLRSVAARQGAGISACLAIMPQPMQTGQEELPGAGPRKASTSGQAHAHLPNPSLLGLPLPFPHPPSSLAAHAGIWNDGGFVE